MPSKSWGSPWGYPQMDSWMLAEGLSPVSLHSSLSCALVLCPCPVSPGCALLSALAV